MTRSRIIGLVLIVVAVAVFLGYAMQRRQRFLAAAPAWLDPQQPPDGVAAELSTLTADQMWAANRCRHMTASCSGRSAGRRVRRTYPGSLAESDQSFIRGIDLEGC